MPLWVKVTLAAAAVALAAALAMHLLGDTMAWHH